jgi:hypothetical protein
MTEEKKITLTKEQEEELKEVHYNLGQMSNDLNHYMCELDTFLTTFRDIRRLIYVYEGLSETLEEFDSDFSIIKRILKEVDK